MTYQGHGGLGRPVPAPLYTSTPVPTPLYTSTPVPTPLYPVPRKTPQNADMVGKKKAKSSQKTKED